MLSLQVQIGLRRWESEDVSLSFRLRDTKNEWSGKQSWMLKHRELLLESCQLSCQLISIRSHALSSIELYFWKRKLPSLLLNPLRLELESCYSILMVMVVAFVFHIYRTSCKMCYCSKSNILILRYRTLSRKTSWSFAFDHKTFLLMYYVLLIVG